MRRGTPIWARGWMLRRRQEKARRRALCMPSWQKAALEAAKWRPFFTAKKGMRRAVSVASAAATFFSFSGLPQLIHLASAQSDITATGRTDTHIDANGNTINITTGSYGGNNALNDFGKFNVGTGDAVNLILPGSTQNLLNFIHDGRTVINGDLYSRLGSAAGDIGGNVWLLNPAGIMIGASGTVNVGSLTMMTPTTQAMNQLLYSLMGTPDASASVWYVDKEKLAALDAAKLKELDMAAPDSKNAASIASLGKLQTNAGGSICIRAVRWISSTRRMSMWTV